MFDGYGLCIGSGNQHADAQQRLTDSVLLRMAEGWIPQGGIAHVVVPTSPMATHVYTQAIVKPSAKKVDE